MVTSSALRLCPVPPTDRPTPPGAPTRTPTTTDAPAGAPPTEVGRPHPSAHVVPLGPGAGDGSRWERVASGPDARRAGHCTPATLDSGRGAPVRRRTRTAADTGAAPTPRAPTGAGPPEDRMRRRPTPLPTTPRVRLPGVSGGKYREGVRSPATRVEGEGVLRRIRSVDRGPSCVFYTHGTAGAPELLSNPE